MIRTQLYLPEYLYEDIKLHAKLAGKSAAEVTRELLEKGLRAKKEAPKKERLSDLAGVISGGPKDLSRNIDKYLYEDD